MQKHTYTHVLDGTLIRRGIVYLLMASHLKQKENQMQKGEKKKKRTKKKENIKQQYAKVDLEQINRVVSRCAVRSSGGRSNYTLEHTLTFGQTKAHTRTNTHTPDGGFAEEWKGAE